MALCKLEMFNLAINADDLFYFFKIFEVVNIERIEYIHIDICAE